MLAQCGFPSIWKQFPSSFLSPCLVFCPTVKASLCDETFRKQGIAFCKQKKTWNSIKTVNSLSWHSHKMHSAICNLFVFPPPASFVLAIYIIFGHRVLSLIRQRGVFFHLRTGAKCYSYQVLSIHFALVRQPCITCSVRLPESETVKNTNMVSPNMTDMLLDVLMQCACSKWREKKLDISDQRSSANP